MQPSAVTLQPSQIPLPSPNPNVQRVWSSGTAECCQDEETCWWGTWCCCILSARNSESFGIGKSSIQLFWAVVWILVTLFLFIIGLGFFAFLSLIIGSSLYAYQRARIRTEIRHKLGVYGEFTNDYCMHCCCLQCTVCQEGREAKFTNMPALDYCLGQPLSQLAAYEMDENRPYPTTWLELYESLSITSQLILKLALTIFILLFLLLIIQKPENIALFLLIFLQPFLILYFVYWRGARRRFATLDYVVKLFVVGFFMATSQSIIFEEILQTILTMLGMALFAAFNPDFFSSSTADTETGSSTAGTGAGTGGSSGGRNLPPPSMISSGVGGAGSAGPGSLLSFFSNSLTRIIHQVHHPLLSSSTTSAAFTQYIQYSSLAADQTSAATATDDVTGMGIPLTTSLLQANILLILFLLFIMAFVIAAGVEETMKHCVIRCCNFPTALKDPQTVLIYLMTAALGFATAENIEYVFGSASSSSAPPIQGSSVFVGELFVLLIRICMPIHVICSVLQAVQLAQVITGMKQLSIFYILLPAIVLHGSFDFFLFAVSAIQVVYGVESVWFDIFCMLMPFVITVAGGYWAYRSFKQVEDRFQNNWRPMSSSIPENDLEQASVHNTALHAAASNDDNDNGSTTGAPAVVVNIEMNGLNRSLPQQQQQQQPGQAVK